MGIFVYMKENNRAPIFRSPSLWLVVLSIIFLSSFSLRKGWVNVITWDVVGYYFYLPALFIDHDIRLEDLSHQEALRQKYDFSSTLYQFHQLEGSPAHVDQYSYGMALAYSPAFFVGHWAAKTWGYEQDGHSWPYQFSLWVWTIIWIAVGFFQLRKLLLHFFSEGVTSWLIVALVVGSNYAFNVAGNMATSHGYLFTYFVIFLNSVIRWQEDRSLRSWFFVCLFAGLAAAARPTEILWMIIPILWGANSRVECYQKAKTFFTTQRKELIVALVVFFVIAFPQLMYWKTVTDHWLFMSYSNPGEGIDFPPHTFDFLFSARKGWFIFTPIAALGVYGLFQLKKMAPALTWPFGVFFTINLFLVSSWTTWWYAQCFSQRVMVQSLPLLLIAIGFLWKHLDRSTIKGKILLFSSGLAVCVGLWFNLLYHRYVIHMDRMTPQYLSHVFYRWNATDEFDHLLLVDHNTDSLPNFEDPNTYIKLKPLLLDTAVKSIKPEDPYLSLARMPYREIGTSYHYGMKIEAEIWLDHEPAHEEVLIVTQVGRNQKPYGYKTIGFAPGAFKVGEWNKLSTYYLTPHIRSRSDVFKSFVWSRSQSEVKVRNCSVTPYQPIFNP